MTMNKKMHEEDLYAHNKNKNKKKQRLLYRDTHQVVHIPSTFYVGQPSMPMSPPSTPTHITCPFHNSQPSMTPSLSSLMYNPPNTSLNDAQKLFRKILDQLSCINVCSICIESYLGITTTKIHGMYACSHCSLERIGH